MRDELDRLFEVEPAEFVRVRDDLVARLKKEGRRDEAADVRRMRRPTATVWALNRLARLRPDDVAALLAAGEAVRQAQQQRAGARLRQSTREVQVLASRLAAGNQEVEAALRAAALNGDPSGELRAGRLQAVPEAPLGPEMWTAGADTEVDLDDTPEPERPSRRALDEARARQQKAQREVDRARARVQEAEEQLARAVDRLEEAQAELDDLERR
ncbi:MAG TPA: hypothetical protein VHF47_03580 [Acidimicrobiales bacterium]|nr:hypothetical protein [Acidimicrobiales bacterium]